MVQWLLRKIIGGNSKRYRFMVVYLFAFIVLTACGKIDAVAFATFTAAVMSWLGVETYRKGED